MTDHAESRPNQDSAAHRTLRHDLRASLILAGLFLAALIGLWVADQQSGAVSGIVRQLWG